MLPICVTGFSAITFTISLHAALCCHYAYAPCATLLLFAMICRHAYAICYAMRADAPLLIRADVALRYDVAMPDYYHYRR